MTGARTGSRVGRQQSQFSRPLREESSAAEVREEILAAGKRQLDRLEAMRKFFVKSRTLSLAQRELLYAKDELEMCTMRMRVRPRRLSARRLSFSVSADPARLAWSPWWGSNGCISCSSATQQAHFQCP